MKTCNLAMLIFGFQDASLLGENMVIAAESLGLGSCYLGGAPFRAKTIVEDYKLPEKVFPLVQLVMGYPDEDPPTRPRYPREFVLFENEYPEFTDDQIEAAMKAMDDGYMDQNYYRNMNTMLPLLGDRKETFTFDTYGWTEHISRKWGQWFASPLKLMEQLAACGFDLEKYPENDNNSE